MELRSQFEQLNKTLGRVTRLIYRSSFELTNKIGKKISEEELTRLINLHRQKMITQVDRAERDILDSSRENLESCVKQKLLYLNCPVSMEQLANTTLHKYYFKKELFYKNDWSVEKKLFYSNLFQIEFKRIVIRQGRYKDAPIDWFYYLRDDEARRSSILYNQKPNKRILLFDDKMKVIVKKVDINPNFILNIMHVQNGELVVFEFDRIQPNHSDFKSMVCVLDSQLRFIRQIRLKEHSILKYGSQYIFAHDKDLIRILDYKLDTIDLIDVNNYGSVSKGWQANFSLKNSFSDNLLVFESCNYQTEDNRKLFVITKDAKELIGTVVYRIFNGYFLIDHNSIITLEQKLNEPDIQISVFDRQGIALFKRSLNLVSQFFEVEIHDQRGVLLFKCTRDTNGSEYNQLIFF